MMRAARRNVLISLPMMFVMRRVDAARAAAAPVVPVANRTVEGADAVTYMEQDVLPRIRSKLSELGMTPGKGLDRQVDVIESEIEAVQENERREIIKELIEALEEELEAFESVLD